ncbi:hypothetical protein D9O36_19615 [Zobellia amurskyensis]|uniref:Uncharacterized protein n=1 Tax=Zobellia amurskyensis TaxID=248905 RepID=A0A7X2ZX88_9FLAO|nr:hypothetical protein [Zobellia amurskyensis]MUH38068.1 hypothetical protein [Zobellia amurskyensis]
MSKIIKTNDKALNNEVQQNRGLGKEREGNQSSTEEVGKPVNNGGDSISVNEEHLKKQWSAVRDEYLANFPELSDLDVNHEKDNVSALITSLAQKRKQTREAIQDEIMNWSSSK